MKGSIRFIYGMLFGIFLTGIIFLIYKSYQGKPITILPTPTPSPIFAYVTGEIKSPGVYSLVEGSRVEDLIVLANGATSYADLFQINPAARLYDGQHLIIPAQGSSSTDRLIDVFHPLNINSATMAELDLLPGVGITKAGAIITYREEHGPFQKIDELLEVPGFGPALFEQLKLLITVNDMIP
jgi:competence protein ComEA